MMIKMIKYSYGYTEVEFYMVFYMGFYKIIYEKEE